jgi:hypothetical protein
MTGILIDDADAFPKLAHTQLFLNSQEATLVSYGQRGRLPKAGIYSAIP